MARIGISALGRGLGVGGGIDIYSRNLISALADHDENEYIVITNNDFEKAWSFRTWPNHMKFVSLKQLKVSQPVYRKGIYHFQNIFEFFTSGSHLGRSISHQLKSLNLDLIHFPATTIYPLLVKTPAVVTFFDLQHEYYPYFFSKNELLWRSRIYKPSLNKADRVIVPSRFTHQTVVQKYDLPEDRLACIPVGLPNGFCRTSEAEINRIRSKYKLPDEFIFYPANPWPHKNHARLLSALSIYLTNFGEAPNLVLSGRLAAEKRNIKSLAKDARLEKNIIDIGFIPFEDLPALYSAATMMVFPSLFEGFGIPLIEAMACGCPVAASAATSIPEVVGGAAILFDPFNSQEIASVIHSIFSKEELRISLGEKGYKQVSRYDWALIIPQIISVYESILAK